MAFDRRTIYFGCILLWLLYGILFPTWIGRLYYPEEFLGFRIWSYAGDFGLREANGFYEQTPIWNPPQTHNPFDPMVRWPTQLPRQQKHVELALAVIFIRASCGVILLGFAYSLFSYIYPSKTTDRVLSIALSISLFLTLGWLVIIALAAFTMGYALNDALLIIILLVSAIMGALYGLRDPAYRETSTLVMSTKKDLYEDHRYHPKDKGKAKLQFHRPLLSFTLGVIASFCITLVVGLIASLFRGPVVGVSELGTTLYAHNQNTVNSSTGLVIILIGWSLGILIAWTRYSFGLALGLIVATTTLGVAFALMH